MALLSHKIYALLYSVSTSFQRFFTGYMNSSSMSIDDKKHAADCYSKIIIKDVQRGNLSCWIEFQDRILGLLAVQAEIANVNHEARVKIALLDGTHAAHKQERSRRENDISYPKATIHSGRPEGGYLYYWQTLFTRLFDLVLSQNIPGLTYHLKLYHHGQVKVDGPVELRFEVTLAG